MSKLLAGLIRGPGAVRWMCRLCDTGVCRGTEGGCPVGNAVRARYGVHGGGGTPAGESPSSGTGAPNATPGMRPGR
jgi:hypothetical protein